MILVTSAEAWEADYLASRLRAEDEAEVWAASGRSPLEVLPESFALSRQVWSIRHSPYGRTETYPISLFGVADDPNSPGLGLVWLLAADGVRQAWLAIKHAAPHWLNVMSEPYPGGLHNIVDARNKLHARWCLLSGFELYSEVTLNGFLFYHVHRPFPKDLHV